MCTTLLRLQMLSSISFFQFSFESLEAGDERAKVIDGVGGGQVFRGGIVDAGDNGGHLLLDDAVVGSEGFLGV
ncbi:hypothetical protein RYX36_009456 [Vicia faba]